MPFKRKIVHPAMPKRSTRAPLETARKKLARNPGPKPRKQHAAH